MRILHNLDLLVLAIALPVFIVADLPLVGWAATTGAWLATRVIQYYAERRAIAAGTRRAAMGARGATLVARLYVVGLTVFGAGLIERKAGACAGILAVVVFTVYFLSLVIVNALEEAEGR